MTTLSHHISIDLLLVLFFALKVECALDERVCEKDIKVSKDEMAALDITGDEFHPEWNDTIRPCCNKKTLQLLFGGSLEWMKRNAP